MIDLHRFNVGRSVGERIIDYYEIVSGDWDYDGTGSGTGMIETSGSGILLVRTDYVAVGLEMYYMQLLGNGLTNASWPYGLIFDYTNADNFSYWTADLIDEADPDNLYDTSRVCFARYRRADGVDERVQVGGECDTTAANPPVTPGTLMFGTNATPRWTVTREFDDIRGVTFLDDYQMEGEGRIGLVSRHAADPVPSKIATHSVYKTIRHAIPNTVRYFQDWSPDVEVDPEDPDDPSKRCVVSPRGGRCLSCVSLVDPDEEWAIVVSGITGTHADKFNGTKVLAKEPDDRTGLIATPASLRPQSCQWVLEDEEQVFLPGPGWFYHWMYGTTPNSSGWWPGTNFDLSLTPYFMLSFGQPINFFGQWPYPVTRGHVSVGAVMRSPPASTFYSIHPYVSFNIPDVEAPYYALHNSPGGQGDVVPCWGADFSGELLRAPHTVPATYDDGTTVHDMIADFTNAQCQLVKLS